MTKKLSILQIGDTDWRTIVAQTVFENLIWDYVAPAYAMAHLVEKQANEQLLTSEQGKNTEDTEFPFDYVLLTNQVQNDPVLFELIQSLPVRRVIYLTKGINAAFKSILDERRAYYFDNAQPSVIVSRIKNIAKRKISILQIGDADWRWLTDTQAFDWEYTRVDQLDAFLATLKKGRLTQTYVLLTNQIQDDQHLFDYIRKWPAYRVIYLTQQLTDYQRHILGERRAFYFPKNDVQAVTHRISEDLFLGQIGFPTRFSESQFVPSELAIGHFKRSGRFSARFSGDFGQDWIELGYLKTFPGDLGEEKENLIWLEHDVEGETEVALKVIFFNQQHQIQQVQLIAGQQLYQLTPIGNQKQYQTYTIIVLAKGKGAVDLHAIHQRRTRHGLGHLLPGGEWQLTSEHEEILSYFNPGNRKAPLVVNFAGTRLHTDGFEMMGPLNRFGHPYLLFTDSRTQGGAFDVGSAVYEQKIVERIQSAMTELGLTHHEVILTGYSMGSYPAMYYANQIKPKAVIVAKPIINLGSFSDKMDFPHHFNTDWPLDMRRHLMGRMNREDTQPLNDKFWQAFAQTDWSKIDVSLYTLDMDEYDGESLPQLLQAFKDRGISVTHFYDHGYHIDKIPEMIQFIESRLVQLAQQDAPRLSGKLEV
jgi:accessory secretory protein Asp2